MFESAVGKKIQNIKLYSQEDGSQYAVATLDQIKSAKEAFQFLDGTEIEKTGHILNLSYVPADMDLDELIQECITSKAFEPSVLRHKKKVFTEDDLEMSNEEAIQFEIPEEFQTKEIITPEKGVRSQDINEKNKKGQEGAMVKEPENPLIKDALKADVTTNDLEDFKIDLEDDRFKDIFEDDNFTLEASNKKFKQQTISKKILEKKSKQREGEYN